MASPTGYATEGRVKALDGTNTTGTFQGDYSAATAYATNDIVEHEGGYWVRVDGGGTGQEPGFNSAAWNPAIRKGSQMGETIDPTAVGGSNARIDLGDYEGQPSSARLAREADRTAAEA